MISVCIPIYNQNVNELVSALSLQVEKLSMPAEIVLIDDCSSQEFIAINEEVCSRHKYFKLETNVGRSKIRNLFLKYVEHEYLLFLDCDATIVSNNLLQNYLDTLQEHPAEVICGGSTYPKAKVAKEYKLRWLNGNVRETIPAAVRNIAPYSSFMTSNVLIRKSVFDIIKFDEQLVKYGHEDTLFGFQLKQKGLSILHVDNSVLNNDLDTNSAFVQKTEDSLINLHYILKSLNYNDVFIKHIKLLNVYFKIKRSGMEPLLRFCFFIIKRPVKGLLVKGIVQLNMFDFYKLGILSQTVRKNNS